MKVLVSRDIGQSYKEAGEALEIETCHMILGSDVRSKTSRWIIENDDGAIVDACYLFKHTAAQLIEKRAEGDNATLLTLDLKLMKFLRHIEKSLVSDEMLEKVMEFYKT